MRVLITGTTSGIGKALSQYYLSQKDEVIGVNRRETDSIRNGQLSHVLDISNLQAVRDLIQMLIDSDTVPDVFVLNAGINRVDNADHFDYAAYQLVMNTNLNGVLTFVAAIQERGLKNKKIVCISSTSNIVVNPGHVAYYLSKLNLHKAFQLFQKRDTENSYKTVILGPVQTNIAAGYAGPQGLQGKIFDLLAVSAETAALACANFIRGSNNIFYFPKLACLFYWSVKGILLFFPGLYSGTLPAQRRVSAP